MVPTHSDYYSIPFKVNLMCINGMKLMKLRTEFPRAQVEPRKKGEDWLILHPTLFFIYTTKDVISAIGKEMLTVNKLNLKLISIVLTQEIVFGWVTKGS